MSHETHVLLITFPAQGHINPTLHFAKILVNMGVDVTFMTSLYALNRMPVATNKQVTRGLTFVGFSDGFDNGFDRNIDDRKKFMTDMTTNGSKAIRDTIHTSAEQGRPVTCLVYTLLLHWASEVACEKRIPCALLWIQPATVLDIYYWYFHGYEDEIKNMDNDKSIEIQLPGVVQLLSKQDLPSFLLPSCSEMYIQALSMFKEQFQVLEEASSRPKVLVNTFDALEDFALKGIEKYDLIGVGPLIQSTSIVSTDPMEKSLRGDLFNQSVDYIDWLNSNSQSSVIYVSFGSILSLPKAQMEEIAKALVESGSPFLWVIRENKNAPEGEEDKLTCLDELERLGKIVPWCCQMEVLVHPALGCFMTHCGWNSTLESISCGVPVVAFPQWTGQRTNAKLLEGVWKVGVRVEVNEDKGLVESNEILRCIEQVMDSSGAKAVELRENARKLKYLAREALEENGSSRTNLKAFLEEVVAGSS